MNQSHSPFHNSSSPYTYTYTDICLTLTSKKEGFIWMKLLEAAIWYTYTHAISSGNSNCDNVSYTVPSIMAALFLICCNTNNNIAHLWHAKFILKKSFYAQKQKEKQSNAVEKDMKNINEEQ